VRANLDGLLTRSRSRGFFLSPLDIPLRRLGTIVQTTKVAAGNDCSPTPKSPVAGGVGPHTSRRVVEMVAAVDSQILPGQFFISSKVYIRKGLEPEGARRSGGRGPTRNVEAHDLLDPPTVGHFQQFNGSVNRVEVN
jgi:hypothetical protein